MRFFLVKNHLKIPLKATYGLFQHFVFKTPHPLQIFFRTSNIFFYPYAYFPRVCPHLSFFVDPCPRFVCFSFPFCPRLWISQILSGLNEKFCPPSQMLPPTPIFSPPSQCILVIALTTICFYDRC